MASKTLKYLLFRPIAPIGLRLGLWLTGFFIKYADLREAGAIPLEDLQYELQKQVGE